MAFVQRHPAPLRQVLPSERDARVAGELGDEASDAAEEVQSCQGLRLVLRPLASEAGIDEPRWALKGTFLHIPPFWVSE